MQQSMAVAGLYAGIFGLIGLWLGVVVAQWRSRTRIAIGDGGDPDLTRAMRGQANFVENVPIALILFVTMALMGAPAIAIHVLGATLVVARIVHGLHFAAPGRPRWQRAAGASLTILVLAAASLGVLGHAVATMVR